ncbi:MAG: autotransporter-associated beta strand repeat-containing protein [bacterium]|nr:autotransporter-associated beta strand repeat-containing protein [bacterium]
MTISGVITDNGHTFTKVGTNVLLLQSANTFTGPIAVEAGTLRAYVDGSFGNSANAITVASGATLDLYGKINVRPVQIGGLGFAGKGTLVNTRDIAATQNGTITLTANSLIAVDLSISSMTLQGAIGESGGAYGITKVGPGMLTLSGVNTYSGGITLSAGTLNINNASALGAAAGTFIIEGGTLNNTFTSDLVLGNNNPQAWNGDFTFTGTRNLNLGSGAVTPNANRIVTVTAGTLAVGGAIGGGAISLTKAGAGTLTLYGANTFSGGATISVGKLVGVSGGACESAVSVAAGTTLGVQVLSSDGHWDCNGLTLDSGSTTAEFKLYTAGSSTIYAPLKVKGNFVNNGTLNVTILGGGFATGVTYPLIQYTGNLTVGTLGTVTMPNGGTATLVNNTTDKRIDLNVTTGNQLVWGNTGTATWNINGVQNWNAGANKYLQASIPGNAVLFDDRPSGDGPYTVTVVASGVSPAFVTVNNAKNYTIAGGPLTVSTGLTKSGTGTLTLSGANSFFSALSVKAGTLAIATINNASANGPLGNSALAVALGDAGGASGTLDYTGASASSTKKFSMATGGSGVFQVDTAGTTLTLSGVIDGSGSLTKNGDGILALSGVNTFTGKTMVNAGTVSIVAETGLGGNPAAPTADQLTLNSGTVKATADFTMNPNRGVTLGAAGGTLDVSTSKTLSIPAILAGNGNLIKTSAGTLALSGINTFTGKTMVNGGTVSIGAESGLGGNPAVATADQLTLNGGTLKATADFSIDDVNRGVTLGSADATFEVVSGVSFTVANVIAGGSDCDLTKTATGILILSGVNTYAGATTISGGILQMGHASALGTTAGGTTVGNGGTLDLNGLAVGNEAVSISGVGMAGIGALANQSSSAASLSGPVTLAGAATIGCVNSYVPLTLSGTITGTAALNKTGLGLVVLSGNNAATLTGAGSTITVAGGTLKLGHANALGDISAGTTVEGSYTLDLNGFDVGAEPLTLAGTGLSTGGGGGTLVNSSATAARASGAITLSGNASVKTTSGDITLSGTVDDGVNTFTLKKNGDYTLTLAGANTYGGVTTISAGTLLATKAAALPGYNAASRVVVDSGATLAVMAGGVSEWASGEIDSLLGATTAAFASGAKFGIEVSTGNSFTYANNIGATQVGKGFVKSGAGTLTLSGANTYTGATAVNGGTLGGAGCSSSATTVNSGATIAPRSVGSVIGTFNTGALTMNAGSTLDWEFDASTADLVAAGTLSFATSDKAVTIKVKSDSEVSSGEVRTLFTFSGSDPNLAGLTFNVDEAPHVQSASARITDHNKVEVVLIPEPGLLALAGLLLVGLRAGFRF